MAPLDLAMHDLLAIHRKMASGIPEHGYATLEDTEFLSKMLNKSPCLWSACVNTSDVMQRIYQLPLNMLAKQEIFTIYETIMVEKHAYPDIFYNKYGPQIAKAFGMRFGSNEEKEKVFEEIPIKLQSFQAAGGIPKLSRWCSWNEQCDKKIIEFWPMKMILEWSLGANVEDPDNVRVAFDHLKGALKEKITGSSLRILKKTVAGWSWRTS